MKFLFLKTNTKKKKEKKKNIYQEQNMNEELKIEGLNIIPLRTQEPRRSKEERRRKNRTTLMETNNLNNLI
jgi:hypothetical protein